MRKSFRLFWPVIYLAVFIAAGFMIITLSDTSFSRQQMKANAEDVVTLTADVLDSDIKSIAFDGGSAAIAALLGNNIDVTVQTPADCKQYLESGDLKCLAVLSSERLKGEIFKDIPTAIEQGYDLVSECYQGCGAAKGQDPEVIAYYEKCFQEALADSEVQAAIENMGFEVLYEDHATYQARWESTAESFATILETLGDRLIIA